MRVYSASPTLATACTAATVRAPTFDPGAAQECGASRKTDMGSMPRATPSSALYAKNASGVVRKSHGVVTEVSGDIQAGGNILIAGAGDLILSGADCAEHFDVCGAEASEPGAVLVIGRDGKLEPCLEPYDRRVAGCGFRSRRLQVRHSTRPPPVHL